MATPRVSGVRLPAFLMSVTPASGTEVVMLATGQQAPARAFGAGLTMLGSSPWRWPGLCPQETPGSGSSNVHYSSPLALSRGDFTPQGSWPHLVTFMVVTAGGVLGT